MPNLEKAIQAMYWAADSDQVGYSQSDRYNIVIKGPDLYNSDCSWLVKVCLEYGGFDTGRASYSGNIVPELVAKGWKKLPVDGHPKPGDVLVAEGHHVALMLHDGNLGQASIDEHGNITGGRPGDQTGDEVNTRPYYNYPWTCYMRWEEPEPEPPHIFGYSSKLYHTNATPMQRFRIRQASGGWVRLESVGRPGMFLDLRDGAKASGTPVRVWEGPTDAQLLKLIPVQKPYAMQYEIEFKHAPGMRLDAKHGGTVDRTGLWIYKDNDTPAQRWQFIDCGDGTYIIVSSKSGLAIDCGAGVQP